jgi:hypothetical protein
MLLVLLEVEKRAYSKCFVRIKITKINNDEHDDIAMMDYIVF